MTQPSNPATAFPLIDDAAGYGANSGRHLRSMLREPFPQAPAPLGVLSRPSPGPYGSELSAELAAAAYPELDLAIDRDEVGWHWLRAATGEEAPMR